MIDERPFLDQTSKPTEQAVQSALDNMYASYQKLMILTDSYSQEWNFSKSSGWMLKVADRKKALFYLIPFNGWFRINLTLRGLERDAFLSDPALNGLREKLSSAKKFSEGYALTFDIAGEEDYQILNLFIRKLNAARIGSPASLP